MNAVEKEMARLRALPCAIWPEHVWRESIATLAGYRVATCRGCQRMGPIELTTAQAPGIASSGSNTDESNNQAGASGMTEIPGIVERVMRAAYEADPLASMLTNESVPWEEFKSAPARTGYKHLMMIIPAAIAAHEAALLDAGLVILPREPTWKMYFAFTEGSGEFWQRWPRAIEAYAKEVAAAHRCSTTDPESTSPVGGTEGKPC